MGTTGVPLPKIALQPGRLLRSRCACTHTALLPSPPGIEPGIFGFVDRRLVHWATGSPSGYRSRRPPPSALDITEQHPHAAPRQAAIPQTADGEAGGGGGSRAGEEPLRPHRDGEEPLRPHRRSRGRAVKARDSKSLGETRAGSNPADCGPGSAQMRCGSTDRTRVVVSRVPQRVIMAERS